MYGPLRDIFCDVLGYPRSSVHIDIAGEAGRPDVTCRAPSGMVDRNGKSLDIDWMVVEAKDEHDAFSTPARREAIFAQKAKYVRPDTAWFVMADPKVIVARPVMNSAHESVNDIVFTLDAAADETSFRNTLPEPSPQRLAWSLAPAGMVGWIGGCDCPEQPMNFLLTNGGLPRSASRQIALVCLGLFSKFSLVPRADFHSHGE